MRDLVTWSQFRHINILPLRGFYFDPTHHTHVSVVTEWQKNGNILQYVESKEKDGAEPRVPELVRFFHFQVELSSRTMLLDT